MLNKKQNLLPLLGPAFLFISVLCLVCDDTPPDNEADLQRINGTVIRFDEQKYKGSTNQSILILSDGEVRSVKVFCDENSLIVGEAFSAKISDGFRDIAWELSQNGKLIYSFDETAPAIRNRNSFVTPLVIVMLISGIIFTPFWLLSWIAKTKMKTKTTRNKTRNPL